MRKYLFVDESGNFDFSHSGSRYFILTSVQLNDCTIGDELIALRREMAWSELELNDELHATEEKQSVRDEVFSLIQQHDFRIDATIFEKQKLEPRLRAHEAAFYGFAWYFHAKHVISQVAHAGDELLIVGASMGTRSQRSEFARAMQGAIEQNAPSIDARTAFWRAGSDPCVTIADYCCWAIQRKWERGDERSHQLIADKISSEFEVFRNGKRFYY